MRIPRYAAIGVARKITNSVIVWDDPVLMCAAKINANSTASISVLAIREISHAAIPNRKAIPQ
jgi:hypothetical protein